MTVAEIHGRTKVFQTRKPFLDLKTELKKINFRFSVSTMIDAVVGGLDLLLNLDSSLEVWIFVGL